MPVWLIYLLVGVALSLAGGLVTAMARQDAKDDRASGVRGTLQWGGALSPRITIGWDGVGGQLRYGGTWGTAGDTPNAYFSRVVEVSCLPIRGFTGWLVYGERVTLADMPTGDLGYAVLEYRREGIDHLWINPYVGDQTAEDPLMLAKFGDDPDRPYEGMIGRGCGYFVMTALVNRELFSGLPDVTAEINGIELDDFRGDDGHDNPIVAIYTLLKGLFYGGEWLYGPQGITDVHFRAANLEAEADKCDAARELAGGGTEKRFRVGISFALEEEPHTIIGELLKACSGRWADLGGVYRFLVGAPAEPVISFTDEDVVISEDQELDPYPGLENLQNAMTATYPEPAEAWEMKEAPPRYSEALETEDDGWRLPFSTEFRAVPYAVQVQELMRTAIEDARRFRRHTQTMPPEWWEIEPLDATAWTSARNGYDAKAMLVTMVNDLPNANQFVALQENEPGDYSWSTAYELPYDVAPLAVARPAPQPMTGWTAIPATMVDADGNGWLPSIEVGWAAGLADVRAVRVLVREAWAPQRIIFDGEYPYDRAEVAPSRIINAAFLRKKPYEASGIYLPYSGRLTEWSAWLSVTTPDVAPLPPASIDVGSLVTELRNRVGAVLDDAMTRIAANEEALGDLAQVFMEDVAHQQTRLTGLSLRGKRTAASVTRLEEVIISPTGSFAQLTERVEVVYDNVSAGGYFRVTAEVSEEFGTTILSFGVKATNGEWTAIAAQQLVATVTMDGAEAAILLLADRIGMLSSAGEFVSEPFKVEAINAVPSVVVTTLYFDNLFSTAEASAGVPIIQMIGSTGAQRTTVPE